MAKVPFVDLGGPEGIPEDDRITAIGRKVCLHGLTVGVLVDDEPAKVARYKKKMMERFPNAQLVFEGKGPTPGAYTLKYAPSKTSAN